MISSKKKKPTDRRCASCLYLFEDLFSAHILNTQFTHMFLMRVYAMCMACFWFVVEKETSSSRRFYYSFHYSLFYYHILLLSSMCRWHFSAMVCRRCPRVGNMIIELVSSFPPNKQKTHFACFSPLFLFHFGAMCRQNVRMFSIFEIQMLLHCKPIIYLCPKAKQKTKGQKR